MEAASRSVLFEMADRYPRLQPARQPRFADPFAQVGDTHISRRKVTLKPQFAQAHAGISWAESGVSPECRQHQQDEQDVGRRAVVVSGKTAGLAL